MMMGGNTSREYPLAVFIHFLIHSPINLTVEKKIKIKVIRSSRNVDLS